MPDGFEIARPQIGRTIVNCVRRELVFDHLSAPIVRKLIQIAGQGP